MFEVSEHFLQKKKLQQCIFMISIKIANECFIIALSKKNAASQYFKMRLIEIAPFLTFHGPCLLVLSLFDVHVMR